MTRHNTCISVWRARGASRQNTFLDKEHVRSRIIIGKTPINTDSVYERLLFVDLKKKNYLRRGLFIKQNIYPRR